MTVTSTNDIKGHIITEYIGLVNANIVVGSNFISDWFASLTDVLGGYSYSYQSKLDEIYDKALKELRFKATKSGANALLGVHFDFDEISGKGKSMFMVTAFGTAVKISPVQQESKKDDRYEVYQKLYNLSKFKDSGIITQEQYDAEKNNILLKHQEQIERDIEIIKTDSIKMELEKERAKEALKKEIAQHKLMEEATRNQLSLEMKKEQFKNITVEKYKLVKDILENNVENPKEELELLTLDKIKQASYEHLNIDTSEKMDYTTRILLKQNKVAEACKYYLDVVNDDDIDYAKVYIQGMYDAMSFKSQTTFEKFAIDIIELKHNNNKDEAIQKIKRYTLCNMDIAEKIIDIL